MRSYRSRDRLPFASFDAPALAGGVDVVIRLPYPQIRPLRPAERTDHHRTRTGPTEEASDAHQQPACAVRRSQERRGALPRRVLVAHPVLDVVLVDAGLDEHVAVPLHRPDVWERPRWFEVDVAVPLEHVAALVKWA